MRLNARGVDRVLERLDDLGDPSKIERALDQAAALVERDAALHAPVDSGQMRANIYVDSPERLKRIIGSDTRQAVFSEYAPFMLKGATPENPRRGPWPYEDGGKMKGTNPNATMPWLRPALYKNRKRIVALIERAIGKRD